MAGTEISPRRRPALWTALSFAAGLLPAHYASLPVFPLLICSILLFLLIAALAIKGRRLSWLQSAGLLLLVFLLGALRYEIDTELLPPNHIARVGPFEQKGLLRGWIAEEPERAGERVRFALELEEVETDSALYRLSGRVLVTARDVSLPADYGDRVVLQGRLRRPLTARNPGAFDYRAFLALREIHGTLYIGRREQLVAVESLPGDWLCEQLVLPVREEVRGTIERNLSGAPAGLLLGMLLGEKYRIPEEIKESFRSTGLAHALVISGLHVGLITAFFFTGFKLCRLPDRWSCGATILVLVIYALVTELQAPVVRASLMAGVILCGRMLCRSGDIYNSLGLAALLILIAFPTSLLSLSFQLSFGATLSIVGLHGPLVGLFPKTWRREDRWIGKWMISPLCVSLAAQLGTGPLIAFHFQQFAPISLVANLVVVPLLGLVVGLGLLAVLTGWCLPLAATAFNACNCLVLELLIGTVEGFAAVPGASLVTPRPGPGFLLWGALLALLAAQMPQKVWARKAGLFVLLVGLNAAVWSHAFRPRDLEVVFLDVGQGDAVFLRFPNGRTMVVDGGMRSAEFDNGARVLLPFLRYRNVDRVDVVVASHPHNDHIGGLISLLEEMEVGHYVDSGQACDTWTAGRLRELIGEKGIRYHRVAAGDTLLGLGGVGGLVLHPTEEFVTAAGESPHDLNNGSVAFRLTYGEVSLLFIGDIEKETDGAMLGWGERLRSRVLKVGHHGSRTSSQPRFVEGVQPEIGVVQVGAFNKFRHPAPEVMAYYRKRGTRILRTDRRGAVILRTDGHTLDLRTMVE